MVGDAPPEHRRLPVDDRKRPRGRRLGPRIAAQPPMSKETERDDRIRQLLDRLADQLIERILDSQPSIREGRVMTVGPPPYRRLDCDARALAYIRSRPRKVAVRVDISGLWVVSARCPLQISSASGAALLLRSYRDIQPAVDFLDQIVAATRAAERSAA